MREIIAVALAGAAGSLTRWGLSTGSQRLLGPQFPWGTLAVNVLGCLVLGFIMEAAYGGQLISRAWRVPITVGFFGAFTTFSAFGYETVRCLQDGAWGKGLVNVVANVILCLVAVWGGLALGRAVGGGS